MDLCRGDWPGLSSVSPVPLVLRMFVSSSNTRAVLRHVLLVPTGIHPVTLCCAHASEVFSDLNLLEGLAQTFLFQFSSVIPNNGELV